MPYIDFNVLTIGEKKKFIACSQLLKSMLNKYLYDHNFYHNLLK